jgi:hypothetical protein
MQSSTFKDAAPLDKLSDCSLFVAELAFETQRSCLRTSIHAIDRVIWFEFIVQKFLKYCRKLLGIQLNMG